MKKCKITVIKRGLNEDLAREFCQSSVLPCPCFKEGDSFIASFEQPEKFCGWAWNDIYKFTSVLLSGGNYSSGAFKGWMKRENEMIACCTDAIRPVTFKIELIDD
jgi:uncharacterized repeat protein (TIGR04076 family)